MTRAIRAAHFVADREDDLIFNGSLDLGIEGLLNVKGRNTVPLGDWSRFGVAFDTIQAATEKLLTLNHHRPYACVLSPHLYASLLKVKDGQQFLELDQITRLCTDGVYQSPSIPRGEGRRRLDGPAELRPRGRAGPRDRVPRAARHELSVPRLRERRPQDQAADRGLHARVKSGGLTVGSLDREDAAAGGGARTPVWRALPVPARTPRPRCWAAGVRGVLTGESGGVRAATTRLLRHRSGAGSDASIARDSGTDRPITGSALASLPDRPVDCRDPETGAPRTTHDRRDTSAVAPRRTCDRRPTS